MKITRKGWFTITGPDGLLTKPDGSLRQTTGKDEAFEYITEDAESRTVESDTEFVYTIHSPDTEVKVFRYAGGTGPGGIGGPQPDSGPDPFTFNDEFNVGLNQTITGDPVTMVGIIGSRSIEIDPTSDAGSLYSIDGGPFTDLPGTITNGQQVRPRNTSSGINSDPRNTKINIGDQSDTFTSTTSAVAGNELFILDFNYSQACTGQSNLPTSCQTIQDDGTVWTNRAGIYPVDGVYTEATADAANPYGSGGLGVRQWVKQGNDNNQTGAVQYFFGNAGRELWFRWYQRYEAGFNFSSFNHHKFMWIKGGTTIFNNGQEGPSMVPGMGSGLFQIAIIGPPARLPTTTSWGEVFGTGQGTSSDGEFHLIEIYVKMDTNQANGEGKMWADGKLLAEDTGLDWSLGNTYIQDNGYSHVDIFGNYQSALSTSLMYCDVDDIEAWNTPPPYTDAAGNSWIGPSNGYLGGTGGSMVFTETFSESCEDTNFSGRGWFDSTGPITLAADPAFLGSTNSLESVITQGATKPSWGIRRLELTDTENVYLSYWIKLSSNWVGSQQAYHPHLFYFLTNKSGTGEYYTGFNGQELTLYSELTGLTPRNNLQNPANPNGVFDDATTGPLVANTWNKIEAFFKLNTMTGTVGNSDGISKCWVNGTLAVNETDKIFRTGSGNEDMKINQFAISPYIGDTSPITQTLWIDEIVLGTE